MEPEPEPGTYYSELRNQFLPYVLKCRRILKVEGYDGNVPLVCIVGIIQLVCGGEYGAIPLLYKEDELSLKYRTTYFNEIVRTRSLLV